MSAEKYALLALLFLVLILFAGWIVAECAIDEAQESEQASDSEWQEWRQHQDQKWSKREAL
jgi:hypothetical protein